MTKKKSFTTEEKKVVAPEQFLAIELVVRIDSETDRDALEDQIMDLLCDCNGGVDEVCRMQYMAGTTGTLDQCLTWLDPEMASDDNGEWEEWDFGDDT